MKLKCNRIFLLLLASFLFLTLTSCNNSISGTYSIKDSPSVLGEAVDASLKLQSNGEFSFNIDISNLNYSLSGTWTIDGNTLTLLCDDATAYTATLDDTVITLEISGDTLIFEKQ